MERKNKLNWKSKLKRQWSMVEPMLEIVIKMWKLFFRFLSSWSEAVNDIFPFLFSGEGGRREGIANCSTLGCNREHNNLLTSIQLHSPYSGTCLCVPTYEFIAITRDGTRNGCANLNRDLMRGFSFFPLVGADHAHSLAVLPVNE